MPRNTSNRSGGSQGRSSNSTTSRGGSQSRSSSSSGRNQSSDWGVIELARERPLTATAVAAGAAAVGLFAWSRRSQISNQLSGLSSQIGEWTQNMSEGWSSDSEGSSFDDTAGLTTATDTSSSTGSASKSRSTGKKSQADFSAEALTLKETGKAQQPAPIG